MRVSMSKYRITLTELVQQRGTASSETASFLIWSAQYCGDRGGTVVKVLRYKSEGRW